MRLVFSCLFMLLVFGCNGSGKDREELQSIAVKRQQALLHKDIKLYLSIISRNYLDKGVEFAAKKKELEANFSAFDRIDYRSDGITVNISGSRATISGNYGLKVFVKGKELRLAGKEELRLEKEPGGWKITGGL